MIRFLRLGAIDTDRGLRDARTRVKLLTEGMT